MVYSWNIPEIDVNCLQGGSPKKNKRKHNKMKGSKPPGKSKKRRMDKLRQLNHPFFSYFSGSNFKYQEQTVYSSPNNKIPTGAVPKPRQNKYNEQSPVPF
jgi:hypothetical protein